MRQVLLVTVILAVPAASSLLYKGVEPTPDQIHQTEVVVAKWRIEAELFCRELGEYFDKAPWKPL